MRKFNLNDEKFNDMQSNLNSAVIDISKKIADGDFEQGDVSLKLTIKTISQYKEETTYEMPVFDYKINTNLQKKSNMTGGDIFPEMELKLDDGTLVLQRVRSDQIDMFDEENSYE